MDEESKEWNQPVVSRKSRDVGCQSIVEVSFVHPQVREYVRLQKGKNNFILARS